MRKILFMAYMLQQVVFAQSNDAAKEKALSVINEISNYIKTYSLVKENFDWLGFEKDIAAIAVDQYHPDSLMIPYINTLTRYLRKGGDKHSFYIGPRASAGFKETNSSLEMPVVILLDSGIAQIKVPSILSFNENDKRRYADTLRMQIATIDKANNINGWVVDLRHNGGGTMWPMLAGLNPLLEDGTVGYFIDQKDKKTPWELSAKKQIGVGKFDFIYKCKNMNTKIAVLTDSLTASSGEMTVIAFLGLPNVKTFGQHTAGFTTANLTVPLSNGGMLLLATKYAADRSKKIYKEYISPDVLTQTDATLNKAKEWLLEK